MHFAVWTGSKDKAVPFDGLVAISDATRPGVKQHFYGQLTVNGI